MTRLGELLEGHPRARILIIGEYLAQIEAIARKFRVPLVTERRPLVSRDTREEEFAHHCKLFLVEQGYSYQVIG